MEGAGSARVTHRQPRPRLESLQPSLPLSLSTQWSSHLHPPPPQHSLWLPGLASSFPRLTPTLSSPSKSTFHVISLYFWDEGAQLCLVWTS